MVLLSQIDFSTISNALIWIEDENKKNCNCLRGLFLPPFSPTAPRRSEAQKPTWTGLTEVAPGMQTTFRKQNLRVLVKEWSFRRSLSLMCPWVRDSCTSKRPLWVKAYLKYNLSCIVKSSLQSLTPTSLACFQTAQPTPQRGWNRHNYLILLVPLCARSRPQAPGHLRYSLSSPPGCKHLPDG